MMPSKAQNSEIPSKPIVPSRFDVIVGRGKFCTNHPGNQEFRRIIDCHLDDYAKAESKIDKSILVSNIVNMFRRNSPNGGFLKRKSSGEFELVSDRVAREKVGQMLRDSLHTQYKSSTASKKMRRLHEIDMQRQQIKNFIRSNQEISRVVTHVSTQITNDMEDSHVEQLFDRANLMILLELKRSQVAEKGLR